MGEASVATTAQDCCRRGTPTLRAERWKRLHANLEVLLGQREGFRGWCLHPGQPGRQDIAQVAAWALPVFRRPSVQTEDAKGVCAKLPRAA
jgi:hypothetical protein